MSNRVGSGCLVLLGRLWSGLGLEWSSSSREGRVELHSGKPVLEFPASPPQISLLYSLTSHQGLTSLRDAYAPTLHLAKYPIQVGMFAMALLAVTA